MVQSAYSLPTRLGLSKMAAALANGEELVLTHIAIGDGDRFPSGVETALLHEVARYPITTHGVVSGSNAEAFFEIFLDADQGPFTIREAGLFDEDGTLIAITREDPPIQKVLPAAGRVHEFAYRMQTVFSTLENIVVRVEGATLYVPVERRIDTDDGITGGGDQSTNRTHKLAFGSLNPIARADLAPDDLFAVYDISTGKHRSLTLTEARGAFGAALFASDAETVAGLISDKKTHPRGVKAAIDEVANRAISSGDGLIGGGNLQASRTIAVNFATPTETIAGNLLVKATHPAGVAAAIEARLDPFEEAIAALEARFLTEPHFFYGLM